MDRNCRNAFTLIELLIVIAIIAIITAILFPVFSSAREKGRQAACISNLKQIALATIEYTSDYDECMPIAYSADFSYGPSGEKYNVAADAQNSGSNCDPTPVPGTASGGMAGNSQVLMPYIKSQNVFQCPDDGGIASICSSGCELQSGYGNDVPDGVNKASAYSTFVGSTVYAMLGSSYKWSHNALSNPYNTYNLPQVTPACSASGAAAAAGATGYSGYTWCSSSTATKCEYVAVGEAMGSTPLFTSSTYMPTNFNQPTAGPVGVISNVMLGSFTRPAETRLCADYLKSYTDKPAQWYFHPTGFNQAFVDGHAKYYTTQAQAQATGCDGIDWAWDYAGSCNTGNIQREKQ